MPVRKPFFGHFGDKMSVSTLAMFVAPARASRPSCRSPLLALVAPQA